MTTALHSQSTTTGDALDRAVHSLLGLQRPDGSWEGEMVWCTMILSQYVIVHSILGRVWDEERAGIVRHYEVTQLPDGSWGLHPESQGYVFTTTLAYVALRLVGLDADHPLTARARHWLRAHPEGVLAIPSWGKFWLALLGLYDYEGVNPSPPELFLLPDWLPVQPWRWYCHTRYIYLAIAYLYGSRFLAPAGPLTEALRRELYGVPYESINFAAHRHAIAASDLHVRPGGLLRLGWDLLAMYERWPLGWLRRRAIEYCYERIVYEQRASRYEGLSPVNALLNILVLWSRDPHHPDLQASLEGLESWKWEDEHEGRRYAGARSQTWDTAFAMQALLAHPGVAQQNLEPLSRAYGFLRQAQLTEELPDWRREHREPVRGGWCFSDGVHRWPVSDCTAEALCAVLALHELPGFSVPVSERISEERLAAAVEFILRRQNSDGSFGTYENRRTPRLLEAINPSEMYGNCMTEGSYLECTGSALCALAHYQAYAEQRLRQRIDRALVRAVRFLRRQQRRDGSFPGFWGINFTYAAFHVVKGLRAAGVSPRDPVLVRTADWLVSKQRDDGGWGEHYTSCLVDRYVEHPQSQVVMASWAVLALLEVLEADHKAIRRGVAWLQSQQRPDGNWPESAVTGVFFGAAMLDYRLYRAYFPVWALARSFDIPERNHSP